MQKKWEKRDEADLAECTLHTFEYTHRVWLRRKKAMEKYDDCTAKLSTQIDSMESRSVRAASYNFTQAVIRFDFERNFSNLNDFTEREEKNITIQ